MLTRVDRVQIAVRDRAATENTFRDVLGAEKVREDTSALFHARRSVVQAGISEFALLEPSGDGPVQAHLERWGEGIFAAGFATNDLSALCDRLTSRGIAWRDEGGQAFVRPDHARLEFAGLPKLLLKVARRDCTGPRLGRGIACDLVAGTELEEAHFSRE